MKSPDAVTMKSPRVQDINNNESGNYGFSQIKTNFLANYGYEQLSGSTKSFASNDASKNRDIDETDGNTKNSLECKILLNL